MDRDSNDIYVILKQENTKSRSTIVCALASLLKLLDTSKIFSI